MVLFVGIILSKTLQNTLYANRKSQTISDNTATELLNHHKA